MHALCRNCANADLLKQLAAESGTVDACSVCKIANLPVVRTDDVLFVRAIKALIRYYYSEWEYHSKLGDGSFESLLSVDNPIIQVNPALDPLEYEDFLLSFLDNLHTDDQVNVITAYGRDIYNYMPLSAVALGDAALLLEIQTALTQRNYFLVEAEYAKYFEPLRSYVARKVPAGGKWFRARVGAKKRAANNSFPPRATEVFYEPHAGASISAPPIELAGPGRLNRPGVSFLYLASEENTAIAEVRPHPGDHVSVGAFLIEAELKIADLSRHDLREFFQSDRELYLLEVIVSIENSLATAAPPSNRQLYSLTQLLADIFRRMGFQGIMFKSTVGTGSNLVLFEPAAASWADGSSRVVQVERVLYEHSAKQVFDPVVDYDVDFDKQARRMAQAKL